MAVRFAGRYAKSLLDLAIEKNVLDTVNTDVKGIQKTFDSSSDLVAMLKSPIIKSDKKQNILNSLFFGKINTLTEKFLAITVKKSREAYLPEIFESFVEQYNEHYKITAATLTAASEVDEGLISKVKSIIMKATGRDKIELHTKVDPNLIGGFVLQFEDKLYDTSVARKLDNLKKTFAD